MSKQTRRTKALKALFPARISARMYARYIRIAANGALLQAGEVGTAKGVHYDPSWGCRKTQYVLVAPKRNGREALERASAAMACTLNWEERA
jgi:hypothetical protein